MRLTIVAISIFSFASYFIEPASGSLSIDGTCGNGIECPAGSCCSLWGFCGTGEGFCNVPHSSVHGVNGHPHSTITNGQPLQTTTGAVSSSTVTQSSATNVAAQSGVPIVNNTKPDDKHMASTGIYGTPNMIFSGVALITAKYSLL